MLEIGLRFLRSARWNLIDILEKLQDELHVLLDIVVVLLDEFVVELSWVDFIVELGEDGKSNWF